MQNWLCEMGLTLEHAEKHCLHLKYHNIEAVLHTVVI